MWTVDKNETKVGILTLTRSTKSLEAARMYGASLSNTRNERGINPQPRPRNPPLTVMANLLPPSDL